MNLSSCFFFFNGIWTLLWTWIIILIFNTHQTKFFEPVHLKCVPWKSANCTFDVQPRFENGDFLQCVQLCWRSGLSKADKRRERAFCWEPSLQVFPCRPGNTPCVYISSAIMKLSQGDVSPLRLTSRRPPQWSLKSLDSGSLPKKKKKTNNISIDYGTSLAKVK